MELFTRSFKMPRLVLIAIISATVCSGQSPEFPNNSASTEYKSVIFWCNMDPANAYWYAMEDGNWITVVDDGFLQTEYWGIFSYYHPARLDIKAEVVTKDIWKQYACTPYDLQPTKHSVQLIIIDDVPNCPESEQTANAGEPFQTNCSVGFSGLWAPEITWLDGDGNSITGRNDTTPEIANYWAEFIPTAEDDGKVITCSATMPPPPAGVLPDDDDQTIHSRNAPQFSAQLCTVTLHVITHEPRNLRICGPGTEAEIGDSFVCESESSPPPDYQWDLLAGLGPRTVHGNTLTVDDTMSSPSKYQCTASNALGSDTAEVEFTII